MFSSGVNLGGGGQGDTVSVSGAILAARNLPMPGNKPRTWGMMITITNDPTPANNITWYLKYNQVSINLYDNANWVSASSVFGGGGGAPGGVNTEIQINNAGAFGGSGLFTPTPGDFTIGTGLAGAVRTFTVDGSAANVGIDFNPKGAGNIGLNATTQLILGAGGILLNVGNNMVANYASSGATFTFFGAPNTIGRAGDLVLNGGGSTGGNGNGGDLIIGGGVPNGTGVPGRVLASSQILLRVGAIGTQTAPNKYQSGSLNTTPEVGADEFLTDKRYFVITTGAARKEYTFNDTALTSGRVPFVTTNGRLTDDASLTYVSNQLLADFSINGVNTIVVRNSNAGTAAQALIQAHNGTNLAVLGMSGTGFTSTPFFGSNRAYLNASVAAVGWAINSGAGTDFKIGFNTTETLNLNATRLNLTGNLVLVAVGNGIQIKEGTNARMGTSVLVAGNVVVANTSVTATTRIIPFRQTDGGTVSASYSITRAAGVSFTIQAKDGVGANNAADTSTIGWILIEPAP